MENHNCEHVGWQHNCPCAIGENHTQTQYRERYPQSHQHGILMAYWNPETRRYQTADMSHDIPDGYVRP